MDLSNQNHSVALDAFIPQRVIEDLKFKEDCTNELLEMIASTHISNLKKLAHVFTSLENFEMEKIVEMTASKTRFHRYNATFLVFSWIKNKFLDLKKLSDVEAVFESVFISRFRDIDPSIRAMCVQFMSDWAQSCKALRHLSYLKYLGWALNDRNDIVRRKALKGIFTLFKKKSSNDLDTQQFFQKYKNRILEMSVKDINPNIQKEAVKTLLYIYLKIQNLFDESEIITVISSNPEPSDMKFLVLKKLVPDGIWDLDALHSLLKQSNPELFKNLKLNEDDCNAFIVNLIEFVKNRSSCCESSFCLLTILKELKISVDPVIFIDLLNVLKNSLVNTKMVISCLNSVVSYSEYPGSTYQVLEYLTKYFIENTVISDHSNKKLYDITAISNQLKVDSHDKDLSNSNRNEILNLSSTIISDQLKVDSHDKDLSNHLNDILNLDNTVITDNIKLNTNEISENANNYNKDLSNILNKKLNNGNTVMRDLLETTGHNKDSSVHSNKIEILNLDNTVISDQLKRNSHNKDLSNKSNFNTETALIIIESLKEFISLLKKLEDSFSIQVSQIIDTFKLKFPLLFIRSFDISDSIDNSHSHLIKCYASLWKIMKGEYEWVNSIEFSNEHNLTRDEYLELVDFLVFLVKKIPLDNSYSSDPISCAKILFDKLSTFISTNFEFNDEYSCLFLFKLISLGYFTLFSKFLFKFCKEETLKQLISETKDYKTLINGYFDYLDSEYNNYLENNGNIKNNINKIALHLSVIKILVQKVSKTDTDRFVFSNLKRLITRNELLDSVLINFVPCLNLSECIVLENLTPPSKMKNLLLKKCKTTKGVEENANITFI